jgi:Protein of unknown function (DUF3562)
MSALSVHDPTPQAPDRENNKHADAIRKLSEEPGVPAEEIKKPYEQALEQFKSATIKDDVPILVSRNVREKLKQGNC